MSRKITDEVARITHGVAKGLQMGNLQAKRDWGFAGDYVRAMRLMLQAERPQEYAVATGRSVSAGDFCRIAFEYVGLDWREHVTVDPSISRPADIPALCDNATKVKG